MPHEITIRFTLPAKPEPGNINHLLAILDNPAFKAEQECGVEIHEIHNQTV